MAARFGNRVRVTLDDGTIKVSLRSKAGIDVHALAAELNGGGHRNAAGILMSMSLEDAEKTVAEGMARYFRRGKAAPRRAKGRRP